MKKIVQTTGHDLDEVMAMPEDQRSGYLQEIDVPEPSKGKIKE